MRKKVLFAFTLIMAAALNYLAHGLNILDARFYYSGLEASKYLNSLPPELVDRYKLVAFMDLLVFIPSYGMLLRELSLSARDRAGRWLKRTARVSVSFDIMETTLEIAALYTLPLHNESMAALLALCTTAKWVGLIAWLLQFLAEILRIALGAGSGGRQGT